MTDKERVLKGLECCCAMSGIECRKCPYSDECIAIDQPYGMSHLCGDALELIQSYHKLLEWSTECGFGYDNIYYLYEQNKNEVDRMSYSDGLLYLAKKSLEIRHK